MNIRANATLDFPNGLKRHNDGAKYEAELKSCYVAIVDTWESHPNMNIKTARLGEALQLIRLRSSRSPLLKALPFWFAATLVGFFSVGFASIFDVVDNASFSFFQGRPYWSLVGYPICFLLAFGLVHFLAPNAAGSGIPQVLAASTLVRKGHFAAGHRLLSIKMSVVKIFSALLCVLGGGAVGREGPTIQIAASLFYSVGRKTPEFFRERSYNPFIIAGGAAGIASAFNTPLGGIVFAIEELARSRFHVFKGVLIFSVVVAGLISQQILGTYLYLGFPAIESATITSLPLAMLVGGIAGFAGAFMGKLLGILVLLKQKFLRSAWNLAVFAIVCGLLIAILELSIGSLSIGPGKRLITGLLFTGEDTSLPLIFGRFISSVVSYLAGSAGGIFAPSLATGAAIGQEVAKLVHSSHVNLMVLLGMIGFLTGVTRAPFTAFVLVLEMTDRHSAIIFMMAAALTAYGAAHLLGHESFYETMAKRFIDSERKIDTEEDATLSHR